MRAFKGRRSFSLWRRLDSDPPAGLVACWHRELLVGVYAFGKFFGVEIRAPKIVLRYNPATTGDGRGRRVRVRVFP